MDADAGDAQEPDELEDAGLGRWLADLADQAAGRERAAGRQLAAQAAEEASFAGVALDLAERGEPVVVRTAAGRHHRGHVVAVGPDFLALEEAGRPPVLVALHALELLRRQPGLADRVTGDRPVPVRTSLRAVLAGLSVDRLSVSVATMAGEALTGTLTGVGLDVVALRLDGDPPVQVHVRLAAVAEVLLREAPG